MDRRNAQRGGRGRAGDHRKGQEPRPEAKVEVKPKVKVTAKAEYTEDFAKCFLGAGGWGDIVLPQAPEKPEPVKPEPLPTEVKEEPKAPDQPKHKEERKDSRQ